MKRHICVKKLSRAGVRACFVSCFFICVCVCVCTCVCVCVCVCVCRVVSFSCAWLRGSLYRAHAQSESMREKWCVCVCACVCDRESESIRERGRTIEHEPVCRFLCVARSICARSRACAKRYSERTVCRFLCVACSIVRTRSERQFSHALALRERTLERATPKKREMVLSEYRFAHAGDRAQIE